MPIRQLKTKNNLLIYIIPILVALLVRIILLINWWDSPVRWYSNIGGLDMKAILWAGKCLYNRGSIFTLHRAFITTILLVNNGNHSIEAVVIIQLISGIIIAPLVAWCALRIWGKRYWALASGLLAALYAPALMYQVLVLKESMFLFFALLSLAAVLWAHKRNLSSRALWVCGIFSALPIICRVSALPFCGLSALWIIACLFKKLKSNKKYILYRTTFFVLGILTVFIPVSITTAYLTRGDYFMPIQTPFRYISKLGSINNPKSLNIPNVTTLEKPSNISISSTPQKSSKINKVSSFVLNMARKTPKFFSASEIPNNVNYYFLKYKLFPLQYLIGPLLLIPLAVTALILLFFNRGILRKESILFIFIFSYMLPICYFFPLARYRVILMPVFCMLAPYPVFAAWEAWHSKKHFLIFIPLVIWATILYINFPLDSSLRATDFVSYGKGMQFKTGKSASALPYFYKAYQMAPYKQMTVVNFADTLIKNRNAKDAVKILIPAFQKSPNNPAFRYYLGIASLYIGKAKQAEQLFNRINPDTMGNLKVQYYYYFGESLRVQNKGKAAAQLYQKAFNAKPNKQQRIILEKSLKACNGK